jgi:RNA polymerase sigma-70 factor (ECF subfamily)
MASNEASRERFEAVFREHHAAVRAFARRRAPAEAVDDVVSETFLAAWRRIDRLGEEPLPWLLGIARNVVGTERRGRARRLRLWTKAQAGYRAHEDLIDAALRDDARVRSALARLSEGDREALTLVAWDDLTPTQAAGVLGIPANRFRVRLHRASHRLQLALADEPPGEGSASHLFLSQSGSKGASL